MGCIHLKEKTFPYRVIPRPNKPIDAPVVFCAVEVGCFNPVPDRPEFFLFADTITLLVQYAGIEQPDKSVDFKLHRIPSLGLWGVQPKEGTFPKDHTTYSVRTDPMKPFRPGPSKYRLDDALKTLDEVLYHDKGKSKS